MSRNLSSSRFLNGVFFRRVLPGASPSASALGVAAGPDGINGRRTGAPGPRSGCVGVGIVSFGFEEGPRRPGFFETIVIPFLEGLPESPSFEAGLSDALGAALLDFELFAFGAVDVEADLGDVFFAPALLAGVVFAATFFFDTDFFFEGFFLAAAFFAVEDVFLPDVFEEALFRAAFLEPAFLLTAFLVVVFLEADFLIVFFLAAVVFFFFAVDFFETGVFPPLAPAVREVDFFPAFFLLEPAFLATRSLRNPDGQQTRQAALNGAKARQTADQSQNR